VRDPAAAGTVRRHIASPAIPVRQICGRAALRNTKLLACRLRVRRGLPTSHSPGLGEEEAEEPALKSPGATDLGAKSRNGWIGRIMRPRLAAHPAGAWGVAAIAPATRQVNGHQS